MCYETVDLVILHQADLARGDQIGAADVEVIPAAAAQIHHLEAGLVLTEMQAKSARGELFQNRLVDLAAFRGRELVGAAQDGIRHRCRKQVAVVERNALCVDRVDALRFLQAHNIGLAALDHGGVRSMRMQFLRDVVAAGAAAEHQHGLACPFLRPGEMAGMHGGSGEILQTGKVGRDRNAAHAGRENEMPRTQCALGAIGAAQVQFPRAGRIVIAASDQRCIAPDVQFHRVGVSFEPVG